MAYGAYGVAKYKEKVIFVAQAVVGDRVLVEISEDRKNFAFAVIRKIIKKGLARRTSSCLYSNICGGLRYLSRVEMDEHKELLTLSDRLKVLMPQIVDKNSIMPRRNMFGEVINRKNGWLFGLGKRSGLWSSPFAMTEFKYPEISKFFEGRDFDYRPPDKIDRKSGIDLRDIKNKKTGQTAYDRMRELVGVVKIRYEDGKEYTLKEIVEKLVMDKKSQLYRLPDNKVLGEDMRQNLILNYVNAAENVAKSMILKEFPQIIEERIKRGNFKQNEVEKANSALNILLTQ